jgi:hypothetical protein
VRIVGSASVLTVLTASVAALLYLVYFESGPSSRQKKQETSTVVETRSSIPEQDPSANSDAMAASERKTLMYTIKRIHDPFDNAQ